MSSDNVVTILDCRGVAACSAELFALTRGSHLLQMHDRSQIADARELTNLQLGDSLWIVRFRMEAPSHLPLLYGFMP